MAKTESINDGPWLNVFCAHGGAINGPVKIIAPKVTAYKTRCELKHGQCPDNCGMKRFSVERQVETT